MSRSAAPTLERNCQREFERAAIAIDVSLESERHVFTGVAENVSEGGLFVATRSLREIGSYVHVAIALPTCEEPIEAVMVVRWIRLFGDGNGTPPGLGLQFVSLAEDDLDAIREFVFLKDPSTYD